VPEECLDHRTSAANWAICEQVGTRGLVAVAAVFLNPVMRAGGNIAAL
jgi:hypothetical protein